MNDIKVDKSKILQQVIDLIEEEVVRLRAGYEQARKTSIEAPGRMQSRYDTMGIEAGWVAGGLAKNLNEKMEALRVLRQIRLPDAPELGALGCIIGIGPKNGSIRSFYFILPVAGGISIPLQGTKFTLQTVTPPTPVGRGLIGKSPGDKVTVLKDKKKSDVILLLA